MGNLNEDDQILELKAWWDEYGRSIVVGVVLAFLTVGGWNFWDQYTTKRAEEASTIYYTMVESYRDLERVIAEEKQKPKNDASKSEKLAKLAEFQQSVDSLKGQYGSTEYAHYASLQNAKYYVEQNDFSAAEAELKDVLKNGASKSIELLASLRLARVLVVSEKYDEALKLTATKNSGAYETAYQELAGDIHFLQGNKAKAFEAYSNAKNASSEPSESLKMKYYNLLEK